MITYIYLLMFLCESYPKLVVGFVIIHKEIMNKICMNKICMKTIFYSSDFMKNKTKHLWDLLTDTLCLLLVIFKFQWDLCDYISMFCCDFSCILMFLCDYKCECESYTKLLLGLVIGWVGSESLSLAVSTYLDEENVERMNG